MGPGEAGLIQAMLTFQCREMQITVHTVHATHYTLIYALERATSEDRLFQYLGIASSDWHCVFYIGQYGQVFRNTKR
jgi:hypothetical protein